MTITSDMLVTALIIFGLRVVNNAIGTIRLVLLARGERLITGILGFFEALIFAVTISGVVTDLSNVLNLFAYCSGFSVGAWLGMALESRLLTSFMIINTFANEKGHEIALALRKAGYGVTEMTGEGHIGEVTMLRTVAGHREIPKITAVIRNTNPDAFIAIEQARSVKGGWVRRPQRNQPE